MFDHDAVISKLQRLKPRERMEYWRGPYIPAAAEVRHVAQVARTLRESGRVLLVQKRVEEPTADGRTNRRSGVGEFSYIAIGL